MSWQNLRIEFRKRAAGELISMGFRMVDRIVSGAIATAVGAVTAYFIIRLIESLGVK